MTTPAATGGPRVARRRTPGIMPAMLRTVLLLIVLATGAWAADADHDGKVEIDPATKRLLDAFASVEARMAEWRALPPARRLEKERGLGGELASLLEKAEGGRLENKALYLLASWRFAFEPRENIDPLLDRIATGRNPSYQQLSRSLLVRLRLRQGRVADARSTATALVALIPELTPLLDLIAFHERVGQPAPHRQGTPIGTAPADPLATRIDPWLLWAFLDLSDAEQRFTLEQLLGEMRDPAYRGKIRLVVVAHDGSPIGALERLGQGETGAEVDLLWANPHPEGDAKAWKEAWKLPALPVTALIGPQPERTIMAVDPTIDQMRMLIGLKPRGTTSGGRGFDGLRGKRRD